MIIIFSKNFISLYLLITTRRNAYNDFTMSITGIVPHASYYKLVGMKEWNPGMSPPPPLFLKKKAPQLKTILFFGEGGGWRKKKSL